MVKVSRFPADGLRAADFKERLRALLVRARSELGLEALGVLEIAATEGQMAPWWRLTEPEASVSACSAELFVKLVEQARSGVSLVHDELSGPFLGRHVSVTALKVRPCVSAGEDALLVVAFGAAGTDAAALLELQVCLEQGLSEDRRDRLARTLFLAVEHGPDPMELTDTHARLFYANAAWEQTFGHRACDAVGQTVGRLLRDPVDSLHNPAFYQFTLATLAQGKTWLGSLACRSADGKRRFVEANVGPFSAKEQGFVGNFAVRRDTSHRLERDQALAVSHREFRDVLSAVPDGVAVFARGLHLLRQCGVSEDGGAARSRRDRAFLHNFRSPGRPRSV
jgi:PAS domain S-box-containing protein